jgi:hypothetical protein
MARRTIEQRLAQLDAQKKTLQARLGKQDRARDTRRKVLLGALVLHRSQTDTADPSSAWLRTWLASELPTFLARDMDKLLLSDLMTAPAEAPIASSLPTTIRNAAVPIVVPQPAATKPLLEPA